MKNFPINVLNNDPEIISIEIIKKLDDPRGYFDYKIGIKNEEENVDFVILTYSIFNSIDDLEFQFVQNANTPWSDTHYYNVIDSVQVRDKYNFGDNCMFTLYDYTVWFSKYNVGVGITTPIGNRNGNSVISLARKIDNALINSAKYDIPDSVPVPVIYSVEIVEGKPIAGNTISIQVNATDPLGKKLFYLCPDNPFGTITFNYEVREAGTKEFYFWMKNEDNYWSLLRKQITF